MESGQLQVRLYEMHMQVSGRKYLYAVSKNVLSLGMVNSRRWKLNISLKGAIDRGRKDVMYYVLYTCSI